MSRFTSFLYSLLEKISSDLTANLLNRKSRSLSSRLRFFGRSKRACVVEITSNMHLRRHPKSSEHWIYVVLSSRAARISAKVASKFMLYSRDSASEHAVAGRDAAIHCRFERSTLSDSVLRHKAWYTAPQAYSSERIYR